MLLPAKSTLSTPLPPMPALPPRPHNIQIAYSDCVLPAVGGVSQASIDACIVESIRETLQAIKACVTEEQRLEYRIILLAVAPLLSKLRDRHGMARKVAARLNVPCGTHYKKGTKTFDYLCLHQSYT